MFAFSFSRHSWIALRNKTDELNWHMPALFARNPGWNIHLMGNAEKDAFMEKWFARTSLLWAYQQIHPSCGAAQADIWRYAVLYVWGGVYIDDDSDIASPLDSVVRADDQLVLTTEKNKFNGDACYIPQFPLSDAWAFSQANARTPAGEPRVAFHGRILPNWLMLAAPGHEVLRMLLYNVVAVVRAAYRREPVVRHLAASYRWNIVMCSTGPSLLTATARAVLFAAGDGGAAAAGLRVSGGDFHGYGGKFKAVSTRPSQQADHYMRTLDQDKDLGLLRTYEPERELSHAQLALLQGRAVQGHNGRGIYVISNGTRRAIPNMETFQALHYLQAYIWVVTDFQIARIPDGPPMPALPWDPHGPNV